MLSSGAARGVLLFCLTVVTPPFCTMPVPILVTYFGWLLPEAFVSQVVGLIPFPTIVSPYTALMYAVMLTYLPFSLGQFYKMSISAPTLGTVRKNDDVRKYNEQLKATHPMFSKLCAAEANSNEAFPFFAAAVLAAMQAGVTSATVCLYATFWLAARFAYTLVYAINGPLLSVVRSLIFVIALAVVGKLFALAAEQVSQPQSRQ